MASMLGEAYVQIRASTDKLTSDLSSAKSSMASTIGSIAGTIKDILGTGFTGGIIGINTMATALGVAKIGATALGGAFQAAGILLEGGFGAAKAVFSGLGSVVGGLTTVVSGVFTATGAILKPFAQLFVSAFGGVIGAVSEAFTGLVSAAGGMMSGILGSVTGVIPIIGGVFSGLASGIGQVFSGMGQALAGVFKAVAGVAQAVFKALGDMVEKLLPVVGQLVGQILDLASKPVMAILGPSLSAMGRGLFDLNTHLTGAIKAEEGLTRLNALVRGTGEVAGWSSAQLATMRQNLTAMSGGTITGGEAAGAQTALLRFQNVRGDQFTGALEGARQLAAIMGTDLSQAAQTLGHALENPEHCMRALRQAGINLSPVERQLIQIKMAMRDMEGAQDVILNKIRNFGDVASEMDNTFQGALNRLRNTWNSVGKSIGESLMPIARIVTEFLQPLIEGFGGSLKVFFGGVASGSRSLLDSAKAWISENRDTIVSWGRMIGDTVVGVIGFFKNLAVEAGRWIAGMFNVDIDTGNVTASITQVLTTVRSLSENIPLLLDIAWTNVKIGWMKLADYLKTAFDLLMAKWELSAIDAMPRIFNNTPGALRALLGGDDTSSALFRARTNAAAGVRSAEDQQTYAEARGRGLIAAPWDDLARHLSGLNEQLRQATQSEQDWIDEVRAGGENFSSEMADYLQGIRDARIAEEAAARAMGQITNAAQGLGDFNRTPRAPLPIKFEFVGVSEMYKAIQKTITGGDMTSLQREGNTIMGQVRDGVQQLVNRPQPGGMGP
jgi:hypothetical protein